MEGKMITVEKSRETTQLVLEFMNTFRKKPVTLQDFKSQWAKADKSKYESYDSVTGGLVPFDSGDSTGSLSGTISSIEMQEIIDRNI